MMETSLEVWWLRHHLPIQGVRAWSLVGDASEAKQPEHKPQKQHCNKFNKDVTKIKRWRRPKETSKVENYLSYKSYQLSEYWPALQVVSRLLGVKFEV